jgi:hypothetical protein
MGDDRTTSTETTGDTNTGNTGEEEEIKSGSEFNIDLGVI